MRADDFSRAHSYQGSGYEQNIARHRTVLAALADRAAAQPHDPYLTTISSDGTEHTITFGEFDERTTAAARWARAELGITSGDVVGLIPANDLDAVVVLVGVLRAGGVCLMLSPADPVTRLRQQAEAQDADVILRSPQARNDHAGIAAVAVPRIGAGPADRITADADPDPLADMLLFGTSGSTSTSKIVAQSHRNAAANAEAVTRHHGLRPGDRLLGFLPIYHANAVHMTLFAALYSGAHAILPHAFDPLTAGHLIERFRPRIVSCVPSILEALLQTWRNPAVPRELDYFVSAAAPLPASTAATVLSTLGLRVAQGYGLTETTNFSTTMPGNLTDEVYRELMIDAPIPSIGIALFGNEVAVLDPGGVPLPPGETGEICIRGHNVMARYSGNAEATAEALRGGWFHSGDLGLEVEVAGKRFVVVTGRTKNIAKVRGESVSLDELERVLREVPGVRDAACFSVPDRMIGERVVAAVAVAPGGHVDVVPALRRVFPPTAIPAQVITVAEIPRTATGKILRHGLAEKLGLRGAGARRTLLDPALAREDVSGKVLSRVSGSFTQLADDPYVQLRHELLENGRILAVPQTAAPDPVPWSEDAAAGLLRQVRRDGLGVVTLTEPLSDDEFIAFGERLGVIGAETDPAVRPYVEQGVILNLISGLARTADASLQPFSVGPLTLHSEGSGRPLAEQPRYVVLMCCDPGGDGTAAQTVLMPMAAVARQLDGQEIEILEHTRYHRRGSVPSVARRIGGRLAFSFRDFQRDNLEWQCEAAGVTEADVNAAFCALLNAVYSASAAMGLNWTRGRLAIIDNTFFFHGRTAGSLGPGTRRHLKRLRILGPPPEPT